MSEIEQNKQRIEEIQSRVDKATKGPWVYNNQYGEIYTENSSIADVADRVGVENYPFIAHSRDDVPWLLQMVKELEQRIEGLEGDKKKMRKALLKYKKYPETCRCCDNGHVIECEDCVSNSINVRKIARQCLDEVKGAGK